jgi:hypothetical protein
MSARKKAAGVDNTARRTWDREEFREKAEKREAEEADEEESIHAIKKRKRLERDPLHQGLIVARSNLTSRDYELNLTERLNKTQVIGLNTPLNQQAGYYCKTCDCVLRDSQSYLDHINGKYHNRALGMSMRVEKSTVEQVRGVHGAHMCTATACAMWDETVSRSSSCSSRGWRAACSTIPEVSPCALMMPLMHEAAETVSCCGHWTRRAGQPGAVPNAARAACSSLGLSLRNTNACWSQHRQQ